MHFFNFFKNGIASAVLRTLNKHECWSTANFVVYNIYNIKNIFCKWSLQTRFQQNGFLNCLNTRL